MYFFRKSFQRLAFSLVKGTGQVDPKKRLSVLKNSTYPLFIDRINSSQYNKLHEGQAE